MYKIWIQVSVFYWTKTSLIASLTKTHLNSLRLSFHNHLRFGQNKSDIQRKNEEIWQHAVFTAVNHLCAVASVDHRSTWATC